MDEIKINALLSSFLFLPFFETFTFRIGHLMEVEKFKVVRTRECFWLSRHANVSKLSASEVGMQVIWELGDIPELVNLSGKMMSGCLKVILLFSGLMVKMS